MANTDVLTGAFSRRYLERQLTHELERSRRSGHALSVLLIDIDHFKRINDRYGHAVGDEVLRSTYGRMRELLPRANDWIGRYGGEEFLAVLLDTDLPGAEVVAQRINAGMAQAPFETSAGVIPVTVSIGGAEVSQLPPQSLNFTGLLQMADRCLYTSKHNGRNRYTMHCQAPAQHEARQ
jgi:diguanylate cyclase (GGDEF)-like protein